MRRNTRDFIIFCEFVGRNQFNSLQNGTSDRALRKVYVRSKLKIHCENEFEKWRTIRDCVGGVGGVLAWVA